MNLIAIYANTDIRISKRIETQPNLDHPIGSYGARLGPIETYCTILNVCLSLSILKHIAKQQNLYHPTGPYEARLKHIKIYRSTIHVHYFVGLDGARVDPIGTYGSILNAHSKLIM